MSIQPSSRLAGLAPCPHGSVTAAELRELGLAPDCVIDFSASTNPLGPSPSVRAALERVEISRYPDSEANALRKALAQRLAMPPPCLLAGNGSVELLWLLAQAYLDPGDPVVVVGPTFGEYERAARIAGARVYRWRAEAASAFRPDVPAIGRLLARVRPRLTFICNPNNPTGTCLSHSELAQLAAVSEAGLLVIDEAYIGFVESPPPTLDLVDGGRVVVLRSLTKDYGLTGLRLGYAVGPPEVIAALRSVQPPWSVNAAAQAAGLAALADEAHLARSRAEVRAARSYLCEELASLGLRVLPSAANFLLVEVGDGRDFRLRLLQQGVCVRDCASFDLPAYVRIGVRTRRECERLVAAIRSVLGQARAGTGRPRPAVPAPREPS